ncbi:hypothetical protein MAR_002039, partial [Mya arenaria]
MELRLQQVNFADIDSLYKYVWLRTLRRKGAGVADAFADILKLTHNCNHVSYMARHLIISSDDTVYQYTLAGQRVREIYTTDGWGLYGIAVSPSRLYITNYKENKLIT